MGDGFSWINAAELSKTENSSEWDALITRGTGMAPLIDRTRDSLYMKFDPLCVPSPAPALPARPKLQGISEQEVNVDLDIDFKEEEQESPEKLVEVSPTQTEIEGTLLDHTAVKEDLDDLETAFAGLLLGSRSTGVASIIDRTRDSLYMKFDPLCIPSPAPARQKLEGISEQDVDVDLPQSPEKQVPITPTLARTEIEGIHLCLEQNGPKEDLSDLETTFAEVNMATGVAPLIDRTRDSLYMKFDPLCIPSPAPAVALPKLEGISEQDVSVDLDIVDIDVKHEEPESPEKQVSLTPSRTEIDGIHLEHNGPKEDLNDLETALAEVNLSTGVSPLMDRTRDSLYMKFDPLCIPSPAPAVALPKLEGISEQDVNVDLDIVDIIVKQEDPESPEKQVSLKPTPTLSEIDFKQEELETLEKQLSLTRTEIEGIHLEHSATKEDLNDLETAFAEVLLLYESGKAYQKNFEHNQKIFAVREVEFEKLIKRRDEKLQYIETKFEEVTQKCKTEQEAKIKGLETENFKLRATLKMAELKSQKLEHDIEHLATESQKLQNLCNEMIQS